MKIAILSDIHGNLIALETILNHIKKNECDKIFFLGDYVLAGAQPKETISLIMKLFKQDNVEMIQGNTDKMISDFSEEILEVVKNGAPIMANALVDDISILSEEEKTFLKNLPENKLVEVDGIKLLLTHGSPRKNNENIFPDTPLATVEEMVTDTDASIIVCGHTHIPCGFQTNTKKTVINVGSVGRPFTEDTKCCYLILDINNGEVEIEHKLVRYDKEKSAEILSKRNFDGADKLSQILINPENRHM